MDALYTRLRDMLARPFNEDGDALSWFLFLGLVVISLFAWTRILKHMIQE